MSERCANGPPEDVGSTLVYLPSTVWCGVCKIFTYVITFDLHDLQGFVPAIASAGRPPLEYGAPNVAYFPHTAPNFPARPNVKKSMYLSDRYMAYFRSVTCCKYIFKVPTILGGQETR